MTHNYRHLKYFRVSSRLLTGLAGHWNTSVAEAVRHNRTVNNNGGARRNIPVDRFNEHFNKEIKDMPRERESCGQYTRDSLTQIGILSGQLGTRIAEMLGYGHKRSSVTKEEMVIEFISCVAINNPFSRTGTNYRDLLNYHGILNSNNVIQSEWSKKLIPLHKDVKTLQELIEIRDGYKE